MHRLRKYPGLDILCVFRYAAQWSAYNNIEHLWSPSSKHLNSVILPSILGDDKEAYKLTGITPEERKEKDNAMEMIVTQYWNEFQFNGSVVTSSFKRCFENEQPYSDYDVVHKLVTGGITALKNNADLMEEMRFLFAHMERKTCELIFRKCVEPRCIYCLKHAVRALNTWQYIKERDFKWANPLPSLHYSGHFMTFVEIGELDNDALKTR